MNIDLDIKTAQLEAVRRRHHSYALEGKILVIQGLLHQVLQIRGLQDLDVGAPRIEVPAHLH